MDHHGNEVWSGNALVSRADADEWAYRFRDLGPVMVPLYASPPVAQEGDADLASRLEDIADTIVNDVEMDAQGRLYACHDLRMASKRLNPSAYPADDQPHGGHHRPQEE